MMASAAPHQEPYTKYPNRYTDMIKPTLTDTQRSVCDVVIRLTIGWHRASARISISTFMDATGKSRRAVIAAKQQLIEMGLLVELEHGGGGTTSEYAIELYYNKLGTGKELEQPQDNILDSDVPPESYGDGHVDERQIIDTLVDATAPTIDEEVATSHDHIITMHDDMPTTHDDVATIHDVPTTTDVLIETDTVSEPDVQVPDVEPQPDTEYPLSDSSTELSTTSDIEEGGPSPTTTTTDAPRDISTISDTPMVPTPLAVGDSEPSRGASSTPPSYKDLNSIIKLNKKTNIDTNHKLATEPVGPTIAISTVRYHFQSLFPDAVEDGDWAFFGWVVSTYGAEFCLSKLKLLREYRRDRKVDNPKGLFRSALTRDYQPSRWMQAKLRGDEAAKLAGERSRQESIQWRAKVAHFDYGAAAESLSKLMESLN